MTTLKLQYDNFDTGEFTEEKTVDKGSLLTIFDQNTEIVQTNRSYTIKRPLIKFFIKTEENYICIMHFAKDAFTVWYCNDPDTKLFQGNYYKESVREIIELFIDNKFDKLNKFIPRTTKNEKSLIASFVTSDFLYTYKKRGVFSLVFYSLVMLPFHYIFLSSIFISPDLFLAIVTSMFPIINFFLIRLHFNYTKHSRNISIKVSSGSPNVTVSNDTGSVEFAKDEIKILLQYNGVGFRNPFAEYSFSRIILHDNRTFDISYMIIEPFELELKLSKTPTKRIEKRYPYMKNYST